MKKSRKALTFTAAMMTAAMLSACHETVYGPPPETVYGPPEDIEQSAVVTPDYDPSQDIPEEVYGPPSDYDPSEEIPEDVYGPPPDEYGQPVETVYGPPEDFGYEEPDFYEDEDSEVQYEESKAESTGVMPDEGAETEEVPAPLYGPPPEDGEQP